MFGMVFGPQLRAGQYEPDGSGNAVWMTDTDENGDPVDFEPTEGADWNNEDPDTLPNWLEDYLGTERYNPDTDGDGLTDSDEFYITGTNPTAWDSDGDGLSDGDEWWSNQSTPDDTSTTDDNNSNDTSTTSTDSDGDLLDEALEASIGTSDYQTDSDGDGFSDHDEYMGAVTLDGIEYSISFNPVVFDSDGDGVGDMDQWLAQTLPNGDYDGDGQENADEVYSYGTRPTLQDTNGDGIPDGAGTGDTTGTENSDAWRANDADQDGVTAGAEADLGLSDEDPLSNGSGYSDWYYWYFNTVWNNGYDLDTDGDGIGPMLEAHFGTSDLTPDSNGDFINDWYEYYVAVLAATDTQDDDGDGLPAILEQMMGTSDDPATGFDSDGDGISDADEWANPAFSDPATADTDGDGLLDGGEAIAGTLARVVDTDGDHLTDNEEVNVFSEAGFNPTVKDSDGDGIPDYYEANQAGLLVDSDQGGIPDRLEDYWELDKNNAADEQGNIDGDNATNLEEFNTGYDIWNGWTTNYDTDGDGMTDVWEIANGLDPNTFDGDVDSDGDLWFNIEEYSNNTNPHSSDNGPSVTGQLDTSSSDWDGDGASNYTELYLEHSDPRTAAPNDDWDGDGYLNEDEIAAGTDPHDANSHPNSGQTGYWQTVVLTVFEGNYQYGQETYELMQPSGLIVTYTTETSNTPMTYHFGIEAAGRSAAVLKADIEGATGNKVAEIISAEQQETWVGVTNPPAQQWSEGDNPDSMDDPHALEKLHASSYNAQYSSWNYDGFEVVKNEKVLPGTYRIDSPGRWSKQGYIMYYTIKVKMKKWQMQ